MADSNNTRQAEQAATEILKKAGCRWDGRPEQKVDHRQSIFERRMVSTPTGGVNGRHR
jgi:hypothetical protein